MCTSNHALFEVMRELLSWFEDVHVFFFFTKNDPVIIFSNLNTF